nr:MAG TPA: hypothetical protein [Caudoviricetes sp.]
MHFIRLCCYGIQCRCPEECQRVSWRHGGFGGEHAGYSHGRTPPPLTAPEYRRGRLHAPAPGTPCTRFAIPRRLSELSCPALAFLHQGAEPRKGALGANAGWVFPAPALKKAFFARIGASCEEVRQFLIRHSSDSVTVCFRLHFSLRFKLPLCFKRILKAIGRIVETGGPYLVHHFHFPCSGVFAAPIFSMLVGYWVWRKLFYNVAHFPFPFCFPLFPRGTFPHRGGVQFRFTGLKQPYIFALLMLKNNPLSHQIRVFIPEKLALFFVVSN